MKAIKFIMLVVSVGFAALFGYANLRQHSIIDSLKPVNLTSLRIDGSINAPERVALERTISSTPGVTACSISREGNVASIIFYPDEASVKTLSQRLSSNGKYNISPMEFPVSGGCPVHKLNSSISELIAMLDIRD